LHLHTQTWKKMSNLCFSLVWQKPFYLILKNNVRKGCSITWDLTFEFWERLVFQRINKQIIDVFNFFFLILPFSIWIFLHIGTSLLVENYTHNLCCNYFDCTFAVKLTKLKIQFHIKVLGKLLHVNLVN
jgi:hypothetical protein